MSGDVVPPAALFLLLLGVHVPFVAAVVLLADVDKLLSRCGDGGVVILFINPPAIPTAQEPEVIPAKRGVESPAIPTAFVSPR